MRGTTFTSLFFVVTLSLAAGLLGGGSPLRAQGSATVTVRDAWLRKPVGDRKDAAVFAVFENTSGTPRAIVNVVTAAAQKAELHEMKMSGGVMRMSPVKQIDVPAHGSVELKPGSLHVMVFGLRKTPMAGDVVPLTFTLDDGSTVSATASVRQDAGMNMSEGAGR